MAWPSGRVLRRQSARAHVLLCHPTSQSPCDSESKLASLGRFGGWGDRNQIRNRNRNCGNIVTHEIPFVIFIRFNIIITRVGRITAIIDMEQMYIAYAHSELYECQL